MNTSIAPKASADKAQAAIQRLRSQDLFKANKELEIEHQGMIYRLRKTAQGKLILTK